MTTSGIYGFATRPHAVSFLLYARAVLVPQLRPTTYNREVAEVSEVAEVLQREGDGDSVAKLRSSRLENKFFAALTCCCRGGWGRQYTTFGVGAVLCVVCSHKLVASRIAVLNGAMCTRVLLMHPAGQSIVTMIYKKKQWLTEERLIALGRRCELNRRR